MFVLWILTSHWTYPNSRNEMEIILHFVNCFEPISENWVDNISRGRQLVILYQGDSQKTVTWANQIEKQFYMLKVTNIVISCIKDCLGILSCSKCVMLYYPCESLICTNDIHVYSARNLLAFMHNISNYNVV